MHSYWRKSKANFVIICQPQSIPCWRVRERQCHFSSSPWAGTSLPTGMARGSRVTEMGNSFGICAKPPPAPTCWISQQEHLCGSLDQPVFALFLQVFASAFLGRAVMGEVFPTSSRRQDSGADVSGVSWVFMALLWLLDEPGTPTQNPLRYSAPLIKFLPSQDPQAVVGNPELVVQLLPRADKCHVVLKNGWIWAIGLFWGSKISSVHIFPLKTEEILYWNANMMKLVTCHSPASHCNVSGAWVSCPSSLFYARSAFFLHITLIKAIHVFFLQIMMFLHSPCSWLALKQHPQHCNGASCCCCC